MSTERKKSHLFNAVFLVLSPLSLFPFLFALSFPFSLSLSFTRFVTTQTILPWNCSSGIHFAKPDTIVLGPDSSPRSISSW
jgi:hypothetical protein